jgi:hypothetical protein
VLRQAMLSRTESGLAVSHSQADLLKTASPLECKGEGMAVIFVSGSKRHRVINVVAAGCLILFRRVGADTDVARVSA